MKFIGVTGDQLAIALHEINQRYNDNILFENCEYIKTRRDGLEEWRVKLCTRDSKAYGSARSVRLVGYDPSDRWGGRRMPKACWHVHGDFFDALGRLAPEGRMVSQPGSFNARGKKLRCRISDHNWVDPWVGNAFSGQYASEMCDCQKEEE